MRFPLLKKKGKLKTEVCEALAGMLGLDEKTEVLKMYQSDYDIVVQVGCEEEVRKAEPDMGRVRELDTRGIILTAEKGMSGENKHFVSRFFAPGVGIDEDPVTGSAHCALADLYLEDGECAMGTQLSKREGVVLVKRMGETVLLAGWATTVIRGSIQRPEREHCSLRSDVDECEEEDSDEECC